MEKPDIKLPDRIQAFLRDRWFKLKDDGNGSAGTIINDNFIVTLVHDAYLLGREDEESEWQEDN